jgi:hypothetical protein
MEHESKTFSDEDLINSPTIKKLAVLSRACPVNINDPIEVSGALAPALVYLIDATDKGNIHFQNKADGDAFFQMMLISHQLITQPRPESSVRH